MNILAVDLSLARSGVARILDGRRSYTSVAPKLKAEIPRIDEITSAILELAVPPRVQDPFIDLVVLEGPSLHSQGRGMCERWGLRGVLLFRLTEEHIPYVEVPPATLKQYATGKGNANKDAMIAAAIRSLGFPGSDNNEADAWCLLAMADAHYNGSDTIAYRTVAQSKVAWPVLGRQGGAGA